MQIKRALKKIVRFRLRTLLIMALVCGVWIGPEASRVRTQKEVIKLLKHRQNYVMHSADEPFQLSSFRHWFSLPNRTLARLLGGEWFSPITVVTLIDEATDSATIEAVAKLETLVRLNVGSTRSVVQPSTETVRSIAKIRQLKFLSIDVSTSAAGGLDTWDQLSNLEELTVKSGNDSFLPAIANLRSLKQLYLSGSFTDEGIRQFKKCKKLEKLEVVSDRELSPDLNREFAAELPHLWFTIY